MTITGWIIEQIATTALLVAAVALICRLLANRPAVQHLLWLVVLARFMAPPGLAWHVTAPDWLKQPEPESVARERAPAVPARVAWPDSAGEMVLPPADVDPEPALSAAPMPPRSLEPAGQNAEVPRMPVAEQPVAAPAEIDVAVDEGSWERIATGANFERLLCAVWLMGGLVVAWRSGGRIVRYAQLVRQGEPAGEDLTAEVRRLADLLGVRPVRTRTAAGIASPFVWCWGRPTLVWPAGSADKSDLARWEGVLAHELAHVRRRDHWTAWLELLASIVWWWNPLLWVVRGRLRQSAEAACDALALSVLPDGRQAYAEAFLVLAQLPRGDEPTPALGVGWGDGMKKSFERRLAMILSQRVQSRVSATYLAAIAVLAVVAIPSWSLSWADPPAAPHVEATTTTEPAPAAEETPAPTTEPAPAIGSATKIEGPAAAGAEGTQAPPTLPAAEAGPPVTYDAGENPYAPSPKVEEGAAKESTAITDDAKGVPTLEIKMSAQTTMELAWPSEEIVRVQVSDAQVLSVIAESKHKIKISGKQEGTARIALWSFEKQVESIQVTVAARIVVPAIKNRNWGQGDSTRPRMRAFLPQQTNPPPAFLPNEAGPAEDEDPSKRKSDPPDQFTPPGVAAPNPSGQPGPGGGKPYRPAQADPPATFPPNEAPTRGKAPIVPRQPGAAPVWQQAPQADDPAAVPFGRTEGAPSQTRDVDVTNLGLAIIEAQGERERMMIELANLRRLQAEHIINEGETKLGEIKEATARHKLQFLIQLAQKAYDSALRQRNVQRQVLAQTEALRQQARTTTASVTEAVRNFNAAEDRVQLIEMIPGIKTENKSPPAEDKPAPAVKGE